MKNEYWSNGTLEKFWNFLLGEYNAPITVVVLILPRE
jgi:hypothetical protein